MTGRVIAVVGASGVGKDSVMEGLYAALPNAHLVRRVITRDKDAGGEDFDAVSETEFEALVENGSFVMHWHAHGLFYGIPTTIKHQLDQGKDCLINLSRDTLQRAENIFPTVVVLNLTAAPQTIAQRLVSRNRETQDEIARRLNAATKTLPDGLNVLHLSNDGPLAETVARGIALLCPDSEAIPVDVQGKTPNTKNSETAS